MWQHAISDVVSAIGAVSSVTAIVMQARADAHRGARRRIAAVLREFNFTPDGVVRLLDAVAEGREVAPTDVEQILTRFNDAQWRVEQRLDMIELGRWRESFAFDIPTVNALQEIAWSKNRVRAAIQAILNRPAFEFSEADRQQAAEFRDQVIELNRALAAMDRQLLA